MANKVFYAHDPVEYAAHSINKAAQVSLARVTADEGAIVKLSVGRHLWSQGLVTFPQATKATHCWWDWTVVAKPTFLGHQVYRWLKKQGAYDLRA